MKLTITELAQFDVDSKVTLDQIERTRDKPGNREDVEASLAAKRIRRLADKLMGTEVRVS